jgi:hypothetical protein
VTAYTLSRADFESSGAMEVERELLGVKMGFIRDMRPFRAMRWASAKIQVCEVSTYGM